MNQDEINEVVNSLTRISSSRKYWFVRTQGGAYYDSFLENSYIAIGYDTIRLSTIKQAYENPNSKLALSDAIKERFPEETRPGYIGNQLIDFCYNIKKNDIVVIPSVSSTYVSIGEVESTPINELDKSVDEKDCPFLKRKKIKWLKTNIKLSNLDPELIKLKYTQRTVTRVPDELTSFIDRKILPIFIKDENAHLALNVQKEESISAYSLFSTWIDLLDLVEEFGKEQNLEIEKEDFDLRINVQSPGTIEFITYSIVGLAVLSLMVAALVGAEYKTNSKFFEMHFKTEGLFSKLGLFLDKRRDRIDQKRLTEKVTEMDLNPEEFVEILKQLRSNKGNEK